MSPSSAAPQPDPPPLAPSLLFSPLAPEDEQEIQTKIWARRQDVEREIEEFRRAKERELREFEEGLRREARERSAKATPAQAGATDATGRMRERRNTGDSVTTAREHAQFAGVFAPTFLPLLDGRYRVPPEVNGEARKGRKVEGADGDREEGRTAPKPANRRPPSLKSPLVSSLKSWSGSSSDGSLSSTKKAKSPKKVTFAFDDEDYVPSRSSPPPAKIVWTIAPLPPMGHGYYDGQDGGEGEAVGEYEEEDEADTSGEFEGEDGGEGLVDSDDDGNDSRMLARHVEQLPQALRYEQPSDQLVTPNRSLLDSTTTTTPSNSTSTTPTTTTTSTSTSNPEEESTVSFDRHATTTTTGTDNPANYNNSLSGFSIAQPLAQPSLPQQPFSTASFTSNSFFNTTTAADLHHSQPSTSPFPPPQHTFAMPADKYDSDDDGLFDLDEQIPDEISRTPPHRDLSPLLEATKLALERNPPQPKSSYIPSSSSYIPPSVSASYAPPSTGLSFAKQPPAAVAGSFTGAHSRHSSLSAGFFHTPLTSNTTVPASLPNHAGAFAPNSARNSLLAHHDPTRFRRRSITKYIPSPPPEEAGATDSPTAAPQQQPPSDLPPGSLPVSINHTPSSPPSSASPARQDHGAVPASHDPRATSFLGADRFGYAMSPYRTRFAQEVAEQALAEGCAGDAHVGGVDGGTGLDPGSVSVLGSMRRDGGFSFSRKLEMEEEMERRSRVGRGGRGAAGGYGGSVRNW